MSEPKSITVALQHPVAHEGRDITSVTVRQPIVNDLLLAERRAAPGSDVDADASLLAQCSGLPRKAVGLLTAADFRTIMREARAQGFFGRVETAASDATSSSSTPGPDGGSGKSSS